MNDLPVKITASHLVELINDRSEERRLALFLRQRGLKQGSKAGHEIS